MAELQSCKCDIVVVMSVSVAVKNFCIVSCQLFLLLTFTEGNGATVTGKLTKQVCMCVCGLGHLV